MQHMSRNVSLLSAFNKSCANLPNKKDLIFKRTGLFCIDELQTPEGFQRLRDDAVGQAKDVVQEITNFNLKSSTDGVAARTSLVCLFDELSNCLCKVADLAEFIRVGHPQLKYRVCAEQASLSIGTLVEKLNTDKRLYDCLNCVSLDCDLESHVARLFLSDFEQCGIHLEDRKRKLVLQLNENILKLGSIFSAYANQGRVVSVNNLPASIVNMFPSNGSGLKVVSSLHADAENELVRETAYKIFLQSDPDQDEILTNLLRSRLELSKLCGFESYAFRAVKGSVAGSPIVVKDFLDILNARIRKLANKDYDEMLSLKRQATNGGTATKLHAWDVAYYSAIHKRGVFNKSVVESMPYFSVGVCMEGLNIIFNELYGVRMQVDTCQPGELWHNSVIKLSIVEKETEEILGYIYCDLFERPMKQNQDCHHTIRGGCFLRDGTYQLPIVVLMLSLPESTELSPALLTPSMVDNLFHEMGHAMHSMLARTKYQHITGTRCSTDLAEVPSILMEFFASDPRVISRFARHHVTGQMMPDELMRRWIKSKKIFNASETQLQVFYAALDQAYHDSEVCENESTTRVLERIQAQYYSLPYVEDTAWQLRFSHLVGYGAKYYSYLVSRAVASAIWARLFATDPLSRIAGQHYRREVLAPGGGKPSRDIAEDVLSCRVDADFIAEHVVTSLNQPVVGN